ncbi:uncharacterized protein C1orf53 homolog isoform X1 [Colossoma macropomum]|uniref:uncharacterized protein C1orf53 homolog isoform X1 n=1 Tax=Colossoma macropomum TaxID=42526 RepID=UPI001864F1BE|nr:uncharacterized protein C1orf53 homolog isoform X1 [Colossoma macropomum]
MLLLSGLCRSSWTLRGGPKLGRAPIIMSAQTCSACSDLGEEGDTLTCSHHNTLEDEAKSEERSVGKTAGPPQLLEENRLSEQEKVIHRLHQEACKAGEQTYIDPLSGYKVFTEFAHKQRGRCCGCACSVHMAKLMCKIHLRRKPSTLPFMYSRAANRFPSKSFFFFFVCAYTDFGLNVHSPYSPFEMMKSCTPDVQPTLLELVR